MSIIRSLPKTQDHKESLGLSAIGSSGGWEVAIDEETSGTTQKWFAQIEGRSVYLYFAVESPSVIDRMLDFVTKQSTDKNGLHGSTAQRVAEIALGISKDEPVLLIRDDEFSDRFFLVAQTKKKLVIRVTIGGKDLNSLVKALRQAKEDLVDAETD